jgi:hypothetical protein
MNEFEFLFPSHLFRPLSKTVKFNTLKIAKASGNKKSFKKF